MRGCQGQLKLYCRTLNVTACERILSASKCLEPTEAAQLSNTQGICPLVTLSWAQWAAFNHFCILAAAAPVHVSFLKIHGFNPFLKRQRGKIWGFS